MEQRANIFADELPCPEGGAERGGRSAAIAPPAVRADAAGRIVRGVVRLMTGLDYRSLTEFLLPDGRRADIAAIDARGGFAIIEVKSSVADFRSDGKWPCYREFCDSFYFAIDPVFPPDLLPGDAGIIITDGYEAAVLRPSPIAALTPGRRRALLLRFARTAAARLTLLADPLGAGGRG